MQRSICSPQMDTDRPGERCRLRPAAEVTGRDWLQEVRVAHRWLQHESMVPLPIQVLTCYLIFGKPYKSPHPPRGSVSGPALTKRSRESSQLLCFKMAMITSDQKETCLPEGPLGWFRVPASTPESPQVEGEIIAAYGRNQDEYV